MNNIVRYRHNAIRIESLDTFAIIKGGFHNGLRDVSFVRALGETPDFKSVVTNLDRKMEQGEDEHRFLYHRISELPVLRSLTDSEYYVSSYTDWRSGHPIRLKTKNPDQRFNAVLADATVQAIALFRSERANATDTMVRNFVVKLWFWLEQGVPEAIEHWSERHCVKIVAENVTRVQEYLFYYMMTLLGCDVLLLNTRADVQADPKMLVHSCPLTLGAFGKMPIPEYVKSERKKPQPGRGRSPLPARQSAVMSADTRAPRNRTAANPSAPRNVSPVPPVPPAAPVRTGAARPMAARPVAPVENSFEELAKLASSIVLLTVLDADGDPVATGSGIMIGKKGFILTNCHVIRAGKIYAVRIEEEEEVYVTDEVIKYNTQLDLAVIRINRELNPLPVYKGGKKLVRGQKVVAIGSPLGLFNSVSDGIISGFRRIGEVDMIQFTAPISHGSSGGAVLNLYGEVIGISTAGLDRGQNINLAVGYEDITQFAGGFF